MALARIRALARIGTPQFQLDLGDETIMDLDLACSFGANLTILDVLEPPPAPVRVPTETSRAFDAPPRDRLQRRHHTR